ncbi:hypothetical protein H5410_056088 [Solanum commersonii]|uniref:Uncharacterized protein n=1 Tax=Solanum commersonii TaxID=4109 RepID=A0A9J5WK90_SOLCO|nr:hypothetical protein H5410_056088 [Solanum commersonii]
MASVVPEGKMSAYLNSNEPQNPINGISWSRGENRNILEFKRAPTQEKPDFSNFRTFGMINGVSWSRGAIRCIFNLKRSPKEENPYFINFCVL